MCSNSPPSLLTLTSVVVASTHPFSYIDERYDYIIPEPVQRSIIYHSFPKSESDVLVYASSDFSPERFHVENVVQIGFHVSGDVVEVGRRKIPDDAHKFKVSATFDRRKITSVVCTCDREDLLFWCDHVVALVLYRIRKNTAGVDFVLRCPISETLLQLNRSQLQKLVQYLISDHTEVLPTAQRLADEILFMKTDDNFINRVHGAPDITVSTSNPSDPHAWALNEHHIQSQVKSYISNPSTNSNIIDTLITKCYSMIRSRDSNALRILNIITNECVRYTSKPPSPSRPPISSVIWDQIVRVWNVLVTRKLNESEHKHLNKLLSVLASNELLPQCNEFEEEEATDSPPKRPKLVKSLFSYTHKLLNNRVNEIDRDCAILHSRVCEGSEDVTLALRLLETLKCNKDAVIRIENALVLYDVLVSSHPEQAYEAGLIGALCPANIRPSLVVHEKHMKSIEKLIAKLSSHDYMCILRKYAEKLRTATYPRYSFPLVRIVTYMFGHLTGSLPYNLGIQHLSVENYGFVHPAVEQQQISLASLLLNSCSTDPQKLTEITDTIIHVIKSSTSVFRLAQETLKHASNESLVNVAFNLALHIVKNTRYTGHRKRWEMVRWVVSCGVEIGASKLRFLLNHWETYFSALEACQNVAQSIIACQNSRDCTSVCGTSGSCGKLVGVDKRIVEELCTGARNLAIQCAKNDPQNCALTCLTLCETDAIAFETSYQIVLESATKEFLTPQQIFTIARYMEHRGYTPRAYRLAVIALQFVHIGYNQDTHALVSEIHWTCNLSHQLSSPLSHNNIPHRSSSSSSRYSRAYGTEMDSLIPLLIRNIKNANLLTEILRRSIAWVNSTCYTKPHKSHKRDLVYEKLSILVEGTLDSYVTTIHSRLLHISPRHYSDFIEFLGKARENFLIAPNGAGRFDTLIDSIRGQKNLRGKKKLLFLLNERFGGCSVK